MLELGASAWPLLCQCTQQLVGEHLHTHCCVGGKKQLLLTRDTLDLKFAPRDGGRV